MLSEGAAQPVRAVERFYRVTFDTERGFRRWCQRVVEFTAVLDAIMPDFTEVRPVIFVELSPARNLSPHAFVSAGARGLATNIAGGAKVDPEPLGVSELPAGLTMLFGDGIDAAEYESRHSREARRPF